MSFSVFCICGEMPKSMCVSLPVGEKFAISDVRIGIIRGQSESVTREKKLAIGRICDHPCSFECCFRGKTQRTLHGDTRWSAGGKNHNALRAAAIAGQCGESTLHAITELRPRLNPGDGKFARSPATHHNLKHSLKAFKPLHLTLSFFKLLIHTADMRIAFHQRWKRLFHHRFRLELIKGLHDLRFRPAQDRKST